jgi:Ca-activated chloride channel family protein
MNLCRRFTIALLPAFVLLPISLSAQSSASQTSPADPTDSTTSASSPGPKATPSSPAADTKDANGYVLRMNVKLVNVFTNVTDSTGAIVGGLTQEDFAISEDGRPQRIAVFERQSELPLSLVLAIDTSGSVRKDLPLEQEAAHKFVHALLRGQDQISLLEFSTDVRQVVPFTNQANRIDRGLASLRGGPATALYDAIYLASENLAKQSVAGKPGRKVMVLVSDGGDTANTVTYAEALEKALRGEVMVYSIIDVPIEASAGRDTGGEHALITLAEQTGGKYFYANRGGLDKAFAQVSEDLRTQYLLGYYPAKQPPGVTFHRIRVTVPRAEEKAFDIRYRSGYYADAPSPN